MIHKCDEWKKWKEDEEETTEFVKYYIIQPKWVLSKGASLITMRPYPSVKKIGEWILLFHIIFFTPCVNSLVLRHVERKNKHLSDVMLHWKWCFSRDVQLGLLLEHTYGEDEMS